MTLLIKIVLLTLIFIFSGTLLADPSFLANDPKRPVDKISHDLGLEPQQFVACFQLVHPAAQGTKPTIEGVQVNKNKLLGCLQKANPEITNDKLDTVMDRYRLGGHEAQEPSQ